jgi:MscS family membrane protein
MKHLRLFLSTLLFAVLLAAAPAQEPAPAAEPARQTAPAAGQADADRAQHDLNTTAAAAVAAGRAAPATPEFLEHMVDLLLGAFDVKTSGNTPARYLISLVILLGCYVLRRIVTTVIFGFLKKLAARTETTLDDKLFPALETPVASLIVVVGGVAALKALKFSESADNLLGYIYTVAFSLVIFWIVLRAFNTVLEHMHEVARERKLGIAAFMPWIRKALVTIVVIFGGLMIAQSLGADVKAFLAGLGIGGLAFALAAQDTIANLFGSVVVAVDQPFKIGEAVQIGANIGVVEDIGLRSTKIRTLDKSLVIIPNKTVAAEAITNLSRFTQRRVSQTIGLTYDTKPEQMQAIIEDFRQLILGEEGVDKASVVVHFTNYGASSLDILVVYLLISPDFLNHLRIKERINLGMMRAVAARGLSFAFPTQTLHLPTPIVEKIADRK